MIEIIATLDGNNNQSLEGSKYDLNKPDLTFLFEYFPYALVEVAKVSAFGEQKYARGNWLKVPQAEQRYEAALLRHLLYRYNDEPNYDFDEESHLLHLAHVAWNALAILELYLKRNRDSINKE